MGANPSRQLLSIVTIMLVTGLCFALSKCDDSSASQSDSPPNHPEKRERPRPAASTVHTIEKHGSSDDEVTWTDPDSGRSLRVRRTLRMTASPSITEDGTQATADIGIRIFEGAERWSDSDRTWQPMDDAQFRRWAANEPARNPLEYATKASITKGIDPTSKQPQVISTSAFGIDGNAPNKDWSKSGSGIAIRLDWDEDRLVVWWRSLVIGVDEAEATLDLPFPPRFQSPDD